MFNSQSSYPTSLREVNFLARVYFWMSAALALTAASAYWVFNTPAVYTAIFSSPPLLIILMIVQVGLAIMLTGFLQHISFVSAFLAFVAYALLLGVTLSSIFMIYTTASIASTFLVTSATFAAMALYGYFTKSDLSSLGSILFTALIGLIVAGLVNLFLQSPKFEVVISGIGVLIFTLLVAVDSQRIKYLGQELLGDRQAINKVALLGALMLYLDFVNLFLFLLRFFGRGRSNE